MPYQQRQVEVECDKCKAKGTVNANNFSNTIYACPKCGNVILVPKLETLRPQAEE